MAPLDYIGIVLISATGLGIAVTFAWFLWLGPAIYWKKLAETKVRYHGSVNQLHLKTALTSALLQLSMIWPRVNELEPELRIEVMGAPFWYDEGLGKVVAGLSNYSGDIMVGNDLKELPHEIAHFAEYRFDRRANPTHEGWETRGIFAAVRNYQRAIGLLP